jgi:hypothetical protein
MATIEGFSWARIVAKGMQRVHENEGIPLRKIEYRSRLRSTSVDQSAHARQQNQFTHWVPPELALYLKAINNWDPLLSVWLATKRIERRHSDRRDERLLRHPTATVTSGFSNTSEGLRVALPVIPAN